MSTRDYRQMKSIAGLGFTTKALIMAAIHQADEATMFALHMAFPQIAGELQEHYQRDPDIQYLDNDAALNAFTSPDMMQANPGAEEVPVELRDGFTVNEGEEEEGPDTDFLPVPA